MISTFEGGYLHGHLLVGHLEEIDFSEFLLLGNPLVGLLLLPDLLLLGFLHEPIDGLLEELALLETVADILLEGHQILDQFLVGDDGEEFVGEIFLVPIFHLDQTFEEFVHEGFPELGRLLNQNITKLAVEVLHEVRVQFLLPFLETFELEVEFVVGLVGQQVVLGRAVVVLEEGVVGPVPLALHHPLRTLVHVDVLGMQQFLQVLLLGPVEFAVRVLAAELDAFNPCVAVLLGLLDVVDATVVVAVDLVLEVPREAALRMLVLPQVAELL